MTSNLTQLLHHDDQQAFILELSSKYRQNPPTVESIEGAFQLNNVPVLVAIVYYALEAQNEFHSLELGQRFGFDYIIEMLGINHGTIPLSERYSYPFITLTKDCNPFMIDFFRILRSSTEWTSMSFLKSYLSSDLHQWAHKIQLDYRYLLPQQQNSLILSRALELAFVHNQNDYLWYWLSPCDVPHITIQNIIFSLGIDTPAQYNQHLRSLYASIIDTACKTFNFALLFTILTKHSPQFIHDEKPLILNDDQELPYRFYFDYKYASLSESNLENGDIKADLFNESINVDEYQRLPKHHQNSILAQLGLKPSDINPDGIIDDKKPSLNPYIVDLSVLVALQQAAPWTAFTSSFKYQRRITQLTEIISNPPLIPSTPLFSKGTDVVAIGDDIIDQLANNNNNNDDDNKDDIPDTSQLIPDQAIIDAAQHELRFARSYYDAQRTFFANFLKFFGPLIFAPEAYSVCMTLASHFQDAPMLKLFHQIGLTNDNKYTFYLTAHAQIPSSNFLFKAQFATLLSDPNEVSKAINDIKNNNSNNTDADNKTNPKNDTNTSTSSTAMTNITDLSDDLIYSRFIDGSVCFPRKVDQDLVIIMTFEHLTAHNYSTLVDQELAAFDISLPDAIANGVSALTGSKDKKLAKLNTDDDTNNKKSLTKSGMKDAESINKKLDEIVSGVSTQEDEAKVFSFLPSLLNAIDISMPTLKYLIKKKIKFCSNSKYGHSSNIYYSIATSSLTEELQLKQLQYFYEFYQRNIKFKPSFHTDAFIQAIYEQSLRMTTGTVQTRFPIVLFNTFLDHNIVQIDLSTQVEKSAFLPISPSANVFNLLIKTLFTHHDATFTQNIIKSATLYYQIPTSINYTLRMNDIREFLHWIVVTFITPANAKEIFAEKAFVRLFYHLCLVCHLPTFYYLCYDLQFKPSFEHYNAITDATSIVQPFHHSLSSLSVTDVLSKTRDSIDDNVANSLNDTLLSSSSLLKNDKNGTKMDSNPMFSTPSNAQLRANSNVILQLYNEMPRGMAQEDIEKATPMYQQSFESHKEEFDDLSFNFHITSSQAIDNTNGIRKLNTTTRLPPYMQQLKQPKLGIYKENMTNSAQGVLEVKGNTTVKNGQNNITQQPSFQLTLKTRAANTLLSTRQVIDTVLSSYFKSDQLQLNVHQHSIFTIFAILLQCDTNFPLSLLPPLPDFDLLDDKSTTTTNTDKKGTANNKNTKKTNQVDTKQEQKAQKHEAELAKHPYFQAIKHLSREHQQLFLTMNGLRMMLNLCVSSGLLFFTELFEVCLQAIYTKGMNQVLNVKNPKDLKSMLVPQPNVCRLNTIEELFIVDGISTHPMFFIRRQLLLKHCLNRMLMPLIDIGTSLNTKTTIDIDLNDGKLFSLDTNLFTPSSIEKGKKNTKNTKKNQPETNKKQSLVENNQNDRTQYINDATFIINTIALIGLNAFANHPSTVVSQTRSYPYHLFATIYNYLPDVTMSPIFLRNFPSIVNQSPPFTIINLYDQYLGLWFKAHPDEITTKHGQNAFISLAPPNPSVLPLRASTTMLRKDSPLFYRAFNDKLQPLFYLQSSDLRVFIGMLHLFLLHCVDVTSIVDIHGQHFDQIALRLSTSQVETTGCEDLTHFMNIYSRIIARCAQLRKDEDDYLALEQRLAQQKLKLQEMKDKRAQKNPEVASTEPSSSTDKSMKSTQNSEIILPDGDIVVPSQTLALLENNVFLTLLKEQFTSSLNDQDDSIKNKDGGEAKSNDVNNKKQPSLTTIEFIETLEETSPVLYHECTSLVDYLPQVTDKFGVNSIMSTVGSNYPLASALQLLPSSYLMLFQKDAYGRTLLHHMASLSAVDLFPADSNDADVYHQIHDKLNIVQDGDNDVKSHIKSNTNKNNDKKVTKKGKNTTNDIKIDENDDNKDKNTVNTVQDNRLILTYPSNRPLPPEQQPAYQQYLVQREQYEAKVRVAARTGKPLPPNVVEPRLEDIEDDVMTVSDAILQVVSGSEEFYIETEDARLEALYGANVLEVLEKEKAEHKDDGDKVKEIDEKINNLFNDSTFTFNLDKHLQPLRTDNALETAHPLYQTLPRVSTPLDSILCLLHTVTHLSALVTGDIDDDIALNNNDDDNNKTKLDGDDKTKNDNKKSTKLKSKMKKEREKENGGFNPFILTQSSIAEIQSNFLRTPDGSLPMFE